MQTTKLFARTKLNLEPLSARINDFNLSSLLEFPPSAEIEVAEKWAPIAGRMVEAKARGAANIFMLGGHVLRSGAQKYLIDLMSRGYISGLALNGSGLIHDYELALIGATTESVARYISAGQFGLWRETGALNDLINHAYETNRQIGLGEAVGQAIENGAFPYKEYSLLAAGNRLAVPVTVHVGIGCDIIHEHPNCDGAATGALSYNDFLRFAATVQNLAGGFIGNFGSAVTAPEVYLKALSMARNVAHQKGEKITKFCALVCDLHDLPGDFHQEPDKSDPAYFFRPWKTMLVRTVADGGESYYIKGKHSATIPALWSAINKVEETRSNK